MTAASSARETMVRGALTAFSGALVLALIGAGLYGEGGVRKQQRLRGELEARIARQRQLLAEIDRLENEVWALQYDPAYVEWVVRQELGWVRAGERVVKLR
ncbi:MAG: septum formation initiator family protein [Myxococcota bacterium]